MTVLVTWTIGCDAQSRMWSLFLITELERSVYYRFPVATRHAHTKKHQHICLKNGDIKVKSCDGIFGWKSLSVFSVNFYQNTNRKLPLVFLTCALFLRKITSMWWDTSADANKADQNVQELETATTRRVWSCGSIKVCKESFCVLKLRKIAELARARVCGYVYFEQTLFRVHDKFISVLKSRSA